jgi:hypothetical protein
MTNFREQNHGTLFTRKIAFDFALLFTFTLLAMNASADEVEITKYVDKEGNVLFQRPLNQHQLGRGNANDELAILRLESEYQAAIDDAADENGNIVPDRLNDWVNLWTENGIYISDLVSVVAGFGGIPPEIIEPDGKSVQGRENLTVLLEALENAGVNGKRHFLSGARVQIVSPHLAIGQSEFAILEATVVPAVVVATGRYNSVYKKVGRKWLFRQRKQDVDPAWGPASGQSINSIQDLVFDTRANDFPADSVINDLLNRVEKLESQINTQ